MPEIAPPNAGDVQKVVEDRLAALNELSGIQETVTIEWRGTQRSIPVISMPVDLLSYNPGTHRIRAQRSLDPVRDRDLETEPFGQHGQAYLHDLLRGDPTDPSKVDPTFSALKDDLRAHGQSDPGIITRAGVLINGNTRRAALKELGQQDIRVGVLPPDAAAEDRQSIELSLQLRKDHKRDYSFMNFLLAVDERVDAGWPPEKIQTEFRIRATTFERSRWILTAVNEVIDRSTVKGTDGHAMSLRLVDFETHQGKLEELYRAYTALKDKSPVDAEALREQRLLAIALDKSKTDVRLIEPDFSERYDLKSIMPPEGATTAPAAKIPGTSISAPLLGPRVAALRELTTTVLQARATAQSPEGATPEAVEEAAKSLENVKTVLEEALDQAGRSGRVIKKRFAAVDRLSDANEDLRLSLQAVAEARATGTFDPDDLDEALRELRGHLVKLAQLATRDIESPAEGLAWLHAVASIQDEIGA